VRTKRLFRVLKCDGNIEYGPEMLSHKEMALWGLLFSGNFINLLGKSAVEFPSLTHAICLLKGLDRSDGFRSESASELLRLDIAHRGKLILHVDDAITLSLPRHEDTQWCR
jgi:hypothetical protein